MASATVAPSSDLSYDEAVKTVERWTTTGPSDDEKLSFLQEAIKCLSQPGVLQMTEQALKDLAYRTAETSAEFAFSFLSLNAFAREHGWRYPGITPYRNEWNTLTQTWTENVQKSKSYATQTATEYEAYTQILRMYNMNMTRAQIIQAAAAFKELARNQPVGIPANFQDIFLNLSLNMNSFRTRLIGYLQQQVSTLAGPDAAAETAAIETLQREIAGSTRQIQDSLSHLSAPSLLGLLGIPVTGPLEVLLAKRTSQQIELKRETSAVVVKELVLEDPRTMMLRLIAEFIILAMNFDTIAEFAQIWNGFHHEAEAFAVVFETLLTPANLPQVYRDRIVLALEVSTPLVRGLNAFASIVA